MDAITQALFRQQDTGYRDFQAKLIPTVDPARIIGVRTPALRLLAKQLAGSAEAEAFLAELPHTYFDENQLHAFLVSGMKDYASCLAAVERFLPFVDNWASCDQMSPKVFKKHRRELHEPIRRWLLSGETYSVRFGLKMLMEHYLDEDFDGACPAMAAALRSEEYYVRMMQAWYFATALAKQYEAALPYLENGALEPWTHNKAIQKAIESERITCARKDYLRTLRRKG